VNWDEIDLSRFLHRSSHVVLATKEFIGEGHLIYYRFLGRVMGKALFDGQLVAGHLVQYLYKHILGWPISFSDLEMVDEEYHQQPETARNYVQKWRRCRGALH
jgi:hypothetical protein